MKSIKSGLPAAKKTIAAAILLAAMLIVSLSGCAGEDPVPPQVDENLPMVGAFGEYRAVTDEDLEVYHEAMGDAADYYIPQSVSTQVVAGLNYRFACIDAAPDAGVSSGSEAPITYITIYKPLDGPAQFIGASPNEDGND